MEAPSTVTVRLLNFTPSELHIRQLKSSTIGMLAQDRTVRTGQSQQQQTLLACTVKGGCQCTVAPLLQLFSVLLGPEDACSNTILCPPTLHTTPCKIQQIQHPFLPPAGKLATLKGTVTRMSHVRPLMADLAFTCNKCGCTFKVELPDGRFSPPTRCGGACVWVWMWLGGWGRCEDIYVSAPA